MTITANGRANHTRKPPQQVQRINNKRNGLQESGGAGKQKHQTDRQTDREVKKQADERNRKNRQLSPGTMNRKDRLSRSRKRQNPDKEPGRIRKLGFKWCPEPESNRYDCNSRKILSLLCLPISPPGHLGGITRPDCMAALSSRSRIWRREPESNRHRRICNPQHNHFAIAPEFHCFQWNIGAGNEIRTRDPDLGKVVLYQLSYSRRRWDALYSDPFSCQHFFLTFFLLFKHLNEVLFKVPEISAFPADLARLPADIQTWTTGSIWRRRTGMQYRTSQAPDVPGLPAAE